MARPSVSKAWTRTRNRDPDQEGFLTSFPNAPGTPNGPQDFNPEQWQAPPPSLSLSQIDFFYAGIFGLVK